MGSYINWVHGNSLVVESPDTLEPGGQHFGWGTDVVLKSGQGSWFHVPLPFPAVIDEYSVMLKRAHLLFRTEANAFLRNVHIYDGRTLLREFNDLHFDGDFTAAVVPANTFSLAAPHRVRHGIGLSFFVQGTLGPLPNRLVVSAAAAEFSVARPWLATVARLMDRVTRKGP